MFIASLVEFAIPKTRMWQTHNAQLNNFEVASLRVSARATATIPSGLKKFGPIIGRHSRDWLQRCNQSRLSDWPRLHDLSNDEFPRRPAALQHGEIAAGVAGAE